MITVSKQENGVLFTFTNSDKYLYGSGTIEVPFNSLSIIQDESDNITLRKSASNDIFLSARYDTDFGYASKEAAVEALKEILYDEAGISEEEVQEMIDAATSGMATDEQIEYLRRDVNAVSGKVDTKQDILTAGENITINGNVISADAGNNIIELTQAEYDALETKDPEALYIITDAQEINMNDYYTKSEVDASIATKADTSALTAVQDSLSGYVTTTTYESGQYATAQALNALQENKLDASAYTPTDLSEYWTSAQTQSAINAATSGIPSSQVIEALRNDLNTVSGDVENKQDALEYYSEAEYQDGGGRGMINVYNGKTYNSSVEADASTTDGGTYVRLYAQGEAGSNALKVSPSGVTINDAKVLTENDINPNDLWDTIDEKEEVIASALTEVRQDVADIDAKEEVIASALTEVNQTLNNKLDASAYTPTDLSEYWTSGQTQNAINAATSGIPSSQVVEQLRTDLNTVSGEVENKQDALVFYSESPYDDESGTEATARIYVLGQGDLSGNGAGVNVQPYSAALYADSEGGEEPTHTELVVQSDIVTINDERVLTEADLSAVTAVSNDLNTLSGAVIDNEYTVSQAINELKSTKLDASAYTPTDLSQYWTSAQTQTAIDGVKAYFIDLDAIMSSGGITDADWDGTIAAVNAHRPVYIKFYNNHYILESYVLDDNTMYLTASDGEAASRFTIIKNGSNDYSLNRTIRSFVSDAEKERWNGKVSSTDITQIVKLTQASYDALTTKDNQTLYIVVD